ncbi:MAG: flagellar FliJ family protein, partial [Lachnospiraceae bacterium]|nr:flagellar FliJ family protein [Lachnospiraceae bacterium]
MARFRYKMQNILSIKEKMETQAKQAFADAKRKLDLEQEALDRLFRKKEEVEQHAVEVLQGDLDLHEIEDSQMARIIIDQRIEEQKHRVNRATLELETTRALLEEAVKERKTHEKLKEKQFDEFVR